MGSDGDLGGGGLWSVLFKHNTLKTPWGHPGPPRHLQCKEHCKKIAGDLSDSERVVQGLNKYTQTHTHTMWLRILFHGKVLGILEKYCTRIFFFFLPLEHHSLKHGVVAAVAVKKRWAAHAKWAHIQFKPLPTHALFTSRQTSLSIHSIRQTVWWVSQQASPWK